MIRRVEFEYTVTSCLSCLPKGYFGLWSAWRLKSKVVSGFSSCAVPSFYHMFPYLQRWPRFGVMEGKVWSYEGCGLEMRVNERYVKFIWSSRWGTMSLIFKLQEVQASKTRLYTLVKVGRSQGLWVRMELGKLYKALEQQDNKSTIRMIRTSWLNNKGRVKLKSVDKRNLDQSSLETLKCLEFIHGAQWGSERLRKTSELG